MNANLPAWVAWPDALQKTEAQQEIQVGLESKQRGVRGHEARASDSAMGGTAMSHNGKKKSKFSPQQIKFLELYFSGFTMKDAARAAGYRGSSDQALCNTGGALLRRAVAADANIAQLFLDMTVHNQSESGRMKGLSILVKTMFSRR